MKAFLETLGGEYLDDFVYCSVLPLKDLGYTIVKFDGADYFFQLFNGGVFKRHGNAWQWFFIW